MWKSRVYLWERKKRSALFPTVSQFPWDLESWVFSRFLTLCLCEKGSTQIPFKCLFGHKDLHFSAFPIWVFSLFEFPKREKERKHTETHCLIGFHMLASVLDCTVWLSITMNQQVEILSPASYLQNSNWLFQESKGTNWTLEENKRFENALAYYDKDTPDRWFKIAAMIPGKTVGDVMKQYKELLEDVCDIEAGLFPIPGDGSNSFTLEWVNNQGFGGLKQFYSVGGKRGTSTRPSDQERKKGIPWTEEEHRYYMPWYI